ncbi:MAG: CoA transferase [Thermomicrobium sp.]|nr:CoA transferase [Thermomicrobium sp.]
MRIVEYSAFVAAPIAGATLASLGADVIRIEQLGGGVDAKRWPVKGQRSLYRAGLDRGKRSVALDLRSSRGQELAAAIVTAPGEGAGIFVTNLGARGWASYERLVERRLDLIMVALSGTHDGRPAIDYTINAGIGFPLVTGPCGYDRPVNHVLPAWDISAGLLIAAGVLAAERHRRLTGQGQLVELALSDVALTITGHLGFLEEARLIDEPRPRLGNDLFGTYGRDFETADGHSVFVAALTPRQWTNLCAATCLRPAFKEIEVRYGVDLHDEGARYLHRREIGELLGSWVAARTLDEVSETFDTHGVLWSPYRTFKEFVRSEPRASSPPASALTFSRFAPPEGRAAPDIGADTVAVLEEVGISVGELEDLRESGVIATSVALTSEQKPPSS